MVRRFILIMFAFFFLQSAFPQLTYETVFVHYDSAYEFKNLKIIPIRMKGPARPSAESLDIITLNQGIKQGLVTISERGTASTENVHWLRLQLNTNKPVFVGSGEILIGGRQDRMVTRDTILVPNGRDQYISVMCVEEGRWSDKEKKFVYGNYANPRLRRVLDQSKNQVRIWKEISNQLDSNKITSPTLAFTAQHPDKKINFVKDEYYTFFENKIENSDSTIIGFVAISGDKIIGCDIYAGRNLFYNAYDELMQGYIDEAVNFGKTPKVVDNTVRDYMDKFMMDEASQERYLKTNGKLYRYNGKVIHITAY